MKGKNNKIYSFLICVMLLVGLCPITARADIGPKPSVTVTIDGLEGKTYYATLLSERESTGPATAYPKANARYYEGKDGYEIWKKFVEYEDCDGYFFLQEFWDLSEKNEFRWGYYPPNPFKILLYFPEYDAFVTSGVYEHYAFDSYYHINLEHVDLEKESGGILVYAEKSYDYSLELGNLAARIVITILLELAVAFVFGLRAKLQWRVLTAVNVFTQVVLNVWLNIINYNKGQMAFVFYYILLELLVLAVEAVIYASVLSRPTLGGTSKRKLISYAVVANVLSFAAGLFIAQYIPGIF